ncbi:MAG: Eco57I restriction-modification methylase domain-containing protein [Promethearchaeota archaeon]
MNSKESNLEQIFKKYDHFRKLILKNDNKSLKKVLDSITELEKLFLQEYNFIKKEGVYYTSREIADFIMNNCLLIYINEKLVNERLISHPISRLNSLLKLENSIKKYIQELLLETTIFDPSCGTSIFLISAANLINELVIKLNKATNFRENIKMTILKNLKGFDINYFAVIISILKLFNWYYEKSTQDLPKIINILENNIKQNNSLNGLINTKYDIVIGNPPYGNILNKNEKKKFKTSQIYTHDIYCIFLSEAIKWCNGIVGFLVPKSFLMRQNYFEFRNSLFRKINLLRLYDIGPKKFKNATNEVSILIFEPKSDKNRDLNIFIYPTKHVITYENQNFDSLRLCLNKDCLYNKKSRKFYVYTFSSLCPFCKESTHPLNRIRIKANKEILKIINKIEKNSDLNYLNFIDFPNMIRGEEDNGLRLIREIIEPNPFNDCIFLNAKTDLHYFYIKKVKSFDLYKISPELLKGTNYEYYVSPKLLIKHNSIFPEAAFTADKACFSSSIYSLLHDDLSELRFLCGIINSMLIQFYCLYGINNQKNTTINLNQYMIRHLPIKNVQRKIINNLSNLVDEITKEIYNSNYHVTELIKNRILLLNEAIFDIYEINKKERKIIYHEIKNHVNFYKNML